MRDWPYLVLPLRDDESRPGGTGHFLIFRRVIDGATLCRHHRTSPSSNMAGQPNKRQKREEYRSALSEAAAEGTQLPKKKFYRQRAHANPFSDHALT